nr:response regulator transcription factor [uncultured Cellulosilyticum sp.]
MYKILLVEDEKRMQEVLSDYFNIKGCELECASDGMEALEKVEEKTYDLILLDIMMPKLDGFSVCKEIRKSREVPIIFLTAKVDEEDHLRGYEMGADDYIIKPFSLGVLYAKAISLIKRDKGIIVEEKLRAGDICMDCRQGTVLVKEKNVDLEPMQYKLLEYLLHNKNQVLSREQILVKLWGYEFSGNDRVLDNHMKKLRKALGESGKCIRTVIKVGYRLEAVD